MSWSQAGGVSANLNLGQGKETSTYASVTDQSGIRAGAGGFDVAVAGNTNLIGGLIASTAPASSNSLTTGTLTYSDIQNSASYNASQTSIGLGWSSNSGNQTDGRGKVIPGGGGFPLGNLGGFSATPPSALSANGAESSTTRSAVSAGTIALTDAAGQAALTGQTPAQALAGLSRDTSADTTGALKTIFDPQKIQDAFTVTQAFQQQAGQLVTDKMNQATALKAKVDGGTASPAEIDQYNSLEANWGPGGTYSQIVIALSAGAGGNVTGGMGQFAQAAVVNYVQQQGAGWIGQLVSDGTVKEGSPEHAALQAIVACAGAAAANSSCGSAAMGAAAGSLLTNLFPNPSKETPAQKQAQANLVDNLVAGIATATGANAAAATSASMAELQNNWLTQGQRQQRAQQLTACGGNWICQGVVNVRWGATDFGQTAGGVLGMITVPAAAPAPAPSITIGESILQWGSKALPVLADVAPPAAFAYGMTFDEHPGPEQECPPGGCGNLMTAAPKLGVGTYTPISQPGVNNGPIITATPPPPQQPTGTSTPVDQGVPQGATTTTPAGAPTEGSGPIVTKPTAPADPTVMNSDASNAATYGPLKDQLAQENLANIAKQDPRLAAAVGGSSTSNPNFSIGAGTAEDANQLGQIWVGDGYSVASDGKTLISADGTRVYRPPAEKPNTPPSVNPTGVQANFETVVINPVTGERTVTANGHLTILP